MQNWEIVFTKKAYKSFLSLPLNYKSLIESELKDLTKGKRVDIKKVKGEKDIYRVRVGQYRVLVKKIIPGKRNFCYQYYT